MDGNMMLMMMMGIPKGVTLVDIRRSLPSVTVRSTMNNILNYPKTILQTQ